MCHYHLLYVCVLVKQVLMRLTSSVVFLSQWRLKAHTESKSDKEKWCIIKYVGLSVAPQTFDVLIHIFGIKLVYFE